MLFFSIMQLWWQSKLVGCQSVGVCQSTNLRLQGTLSRWDADRIMFEIAQHCTACCEIMLLRESLQATAGVLWVGDGGCLGGSRINKKKSRNEREGEVQGNE
jgi:hypothetical protein